MVGKKQSKAGSGNTRKPRATKVGSAKSGGRTSAKARKAAKSVARKTAGRSRSSKSSTVSKTGRKRSRSKQKPIIAPIGSLEPVKTAAARRTQVSEPPLTPEEIEQFKQMLIQKRQALLGMVSRMSDEALKKNRQDATGDLSSMPIHMADIGTDNYEQEFTLGLLESEQQLLREINQALDRIEKGTYGICVATGKQIGRARLRAKPWAKYCIEYAQLLEKGLASEVDSNEYRED